MSELRPIRMRKEDGLVYPRTRHGPKTWSELHNDLFEMATVNRPRDEGAFASREEFERREREFLGRLEWQTDQEFFERVVNSALEAFDRGLIGPELTS